MKAFCRKGKVHIEYKGYISIKSSKLFCPNRRIIAIKMLFIIFKYVFNQDVLKYRLLLEKVFSTFLIKKVILVNETISLSSINHATNAPLTVKGGS